MSFLKVHLLLTFLKVIYILQTDTWINKTMFAKPNGTIVIVVVVLRECCCSECELPKKTDQTGKLHTDPCVFAPLLFDPEEDMT